MQLIPYAPPPVHRQAQPAARHEASEAMAGVVACMGEPRFAQDALVQLNRWMPLAWWSVYKLYTDAPPTMHASAAFRVQDGTQYAWQVYRSHLYKRDETFIAAREQVQDSGHLLVHWHAREIPRLHREPIYSRHGLRERLSIVCKTADQALLAVNLYRHKEQRAFSDAEIESVAGGAGLLLSCVQKHLSWEQAQGAGHTPADDALAALTRREREVCERMLKGWTYDGIAADLGLSPGTVKTYRDRAFDRLGLHHRNELFALVAGRLAN